VTLILFGLSALSREIVGRQSTDGTFAETFRLNAEGMIEARPVVFPGNIGGEFYELRFVEPLAQAGKH